MCNKKEWEGCSISLFSTSCTTTTPQLSGGAGDCRVSVVFNASCTTTPHWDPQQLSSLFGSALRRGVTVYNQESG